MKMTLEERAAALKHSDGDLTEPSEWESYWDITREKVYDFAVEWSNSGVEVVNCYGAAVNLYNVWTDFNRNTS